MYSVLLVDDEIHLIESLEETIDWKALEISNLYLAYSVDEGIDILLNHSIDIVITDIRMPQKNGLALIQEISIKWPRIRCILLSGYAEFEYAIKAIELKVIEYLMKPIRIDQFIQAVQKAVSLIKEEGEKIVSTQHLQRQIKENLPIIRASLLKELLRGRKYTHEELLAKLSFCKLSFDPLHECSMFIIRLEEPFGNFLDSDRTILEYAVVNIVEELIKPELLMWYCKDIHENLVFLVQMKEKDQSPRISGPAKITLLEKLTIEIQHNVQIYLKGHISLIVGEWVEFANGIGPLYKKCIALLRQHASVQDEIFMTIYDVKKNSWVKALDGLYEPPLLSQLLEAGKWDLIDEKLDQVFNEIKQLQNSPKEHLHEAALAISSAIIHMLHNNGVVLYEVFGNEQQGFHHVSSFNQIYDLERWTSIVFQQVRKHFEEKTQENNESIVAAVHRIIHALPLQELTVGLIADQMSLHPAYLSKIYKTETGENISDHIIHLKLERAKQLLLGTNDKVYEITDQLGYQNPQYMIKIFKRHYGVTPQEYRDQKTKSSGH